MDINTAKRVDWERRRKIRLTQVRDQSKILAKTIRDRVQSADEVQLEKHETARNNTEHKFKSLAFNKLKSDFNYLVQDIGNGYAVASIQPDPSIVLAEKRLINRCTAISRGFEAEKRQQRVQEEHQMDKEMKERQTHFNKTVEKIRSKLITNIPNVDTSKNHVQNNIKQNECFLIPSQVTLNESNINSWNNNKIQKTPKPWSVTFNTNENLMTNSHQPTINDGNKENEPYVTKYTKFETDMKNYETLVIKLNKLSAEEQNIRDRLSTHSHNWKEDPALHTNNDHSVTQKKNKHTNMTEVQHIDKIAKLDVKKNMITENKLQSNSNSSFYISSSASSNIKECPVEPIKKTINIKNVEDEKKSLQSSAKLNYKKKFTAEKPLKNINNAIQRIKKKKQMLVKEISAGSKKVKTESLIPKISPIKKECTLNNDLHKVSPANYAMLPDSFYDCELDSLKKQILKNKTKLNDIKCHKSINTDLMQYINTLLKMTPSDIDNLSISSCSSIKHEESILHYSTKNIQYYSDILNCISKCLNADNSDLSQDTMFDSPKNINLLNRLQQLTNYYLDKTHEMKNICDESPSNDQNTETETTIFKDSIDISSNSSVDGEYILGHLNTILQKKGLIKCDKEWPMFENCNDDDDDRSLTDQLLDVCPRKSHDS